MKSTDIPKIIKDGHRNYDFTLIEFVNWLERSVNDELVPLQMNPLFQRGHVWTEAQQISYIEAFLMGGVRHARTIYFNDPTFEHGYDGYNDFVCVDGLQRTTAIKRFVNDEITAFGTKYHDFEDFLVFSRNKVDYSISININSLGTQKEVLEWYLQINSLGTPHTEEELNKVKNMLKKLSL